jgi:hypothetical protein
LKAKTPEGLNLDNAAIAHVVALLEKSLLKKSGSPKKPARSRKTPARRKSK